MNLKDIIARFSSYFKFEDVTSLKSYEQSVRSMHGEFEKYGVIEADVYHLYNGFTNSEVDAYLEYCYTDMADHFEIGKDDYLVVLGAVDKSNLKYILFEAYDAAYNKKVGNFMRVGEWPGFAENMERVEEVSRKLFEQFGRSE